MTEFRVGMASTRMRFEKGVPLVLGGVPSSIRAGSRVTPTATSSPTRSPTRCSEPRGSRTSARSSRPEIPALAGADSLELLTHAWERVRGYGWRLANADVVLIGEEPRLAPHRDEMRRRLAAALDVEPELVAVRATTTDGLGFTGRGEGLAAQAVALLVR